MPRAGRPIRLRWWDCQLTPTADLHSRNAVLPALNEATQREFDGLAATPRAVEFFAAVVINADVVHLDGASGRGFGSIPDHQVFDDELSGRWAAGKLNLGFA